MAAKHLNSKWPPTFQFKITYRQLFFYRALSYKGYGFKKGCGLDDQVFVFFNFALSVNYSLTGFIHVGTWEYYQCHREKMKHNALNLSPMTKTGAHIF